MKCLVTGGAGFIGSHLADRLIKEGHKVVIIDNLSTGKKENINPEVKFYKIDIQSPTIAEVFQNERPEIIFHLAAQIDVRKSVEDPIKDCKTNIIGSINIIQNFVRVIQSCNSLKSTHTYKIIFSSTGGAIYGDADIVPTPETYQEFPLSPYGICKLTVEKYLNFYWKIFDLPYVALRYANVYGPRQNSKGEAGVIAIFCDKMLSEEQPIINGDGTQTRDFVYVDDVIEANILAMKSEKIGIYNIGTAKEVDINTIFRELIKLTGSKCKEIHNPLKPGEQKRSCLDFEKVKKELGWQPKYDINKGLEKTVAWFRS